MDNTSKTALPLKKNNGKTKEAFRSQFVNILINFLFDFFITDHHLLEGLKTCLNQNKELFQTVYDIKNKQDVFYKEIKEQLSGISEKLIN